MIIQRFTQAEAKIFELLTIFNNLFAKYIEYNNTKNIANIRSIFTEIETALGLGYLLQDLPTSSMDQFNNYIIKEFFESKFKIKYYAVCNKIHEKLKTNILRLKCKQFSEHQINKIIYSTYKSIDNIIINLYWGLNLPLKEHISDLEIKFCALQKHYFILAKNIIEPLVSKVYFKLTIVLFPYLQSSSDKVISTQNLFDKSAIHTFIERSLYFTFSLLKMEKKINDPSNVYKFQPIQQETALQIANVKTKLKKKQKKFFQFLIEVLESQVFYIPEDNRGKVIKLNAEIKELNLWIFVKLNKLCELYFQIFMIKKAIDVYEKKSSTDSLIENEQMKDEVQDDFDLYFQIFIAKNTISTIIEECEKPKSIELLDKLEPIKAFTQEEILDFLNFSLKNYYAEDLKEKMPIKQIKDQANQANQANKEDLKQKIARLFPDLLSYKKDLLVNVLDNQELKLNVANNNVGNANASSSNQKLKLEEATNVPARRESFFVHSPYSYFNSMGWQEPVNNSTESDKPTVDNSKLLIKNCF
jgi:hypothetical protein